MKLIRLQVCILFLGCFLAGGCGDSKPGAAAVPDKLDQPLPPPPVGSGGEGKGKQPSTTGKID